MKPDLRFVNQSLAFWAIVKLASEKCGYSTRATKKNPIAKVKCLTLEQIRSALEKQGIDLSLVSEGQVALVCAYTEFRANLLNNIVEPALMDRADAEKLFQKVKARVNPTHDIPNNRQKGEKKHKAFFSAIVGILAEEVLGATDLVNDAKCLSILTSDGELQGVFSRRFDGAVPDTINPIAIWEVKEYYGTTTFGSRVAGGVYETLLDGFEIQSFESAYGRKIAHYLFVDAHCAWWSSGKSYLCRLIDLLHAGHVDELFFGRQVESEWPVTLAELRERLDS